MSRYCSICGSPSAELTSPIGSSNAHLSQGAGGLLTLRTNSSSAARRVASGIDSHQGMRMGCAPLCQLYCAVLCSLRKRIHGRYYRDRAGDTIYCEACFKGRPALRHLRRG